MGKTIKKLSFSIIKTEPDIYIPKIVKVRCENIKHQIFDGEYSKDLTIFCPSLKPNDNFFYRDFETKQFIPISNTTLNHIDIRLLDQDNRRIKLINGYATIVKLHFKKMPSNRKFFNVRLTSRKSQIHPNNTKNSFTVSLPNTLNLNNQWKVSVSSINHPTTFNTFSENNAKIKFGYKDGKIYSYVLKEKYASVEEMITDLKNMFAKHGFIKISYDTFNQRLVKTIRFTFHVSGVFILPHEVANVLGHTSNSNDGGAAWAAISTSQKEFQIDMENPVDLNYYKPNYVMMYSNIVAPTILGGEFKNILKVFPVIQDKKQDYQIQEFKHFEYYSLVNHEIKDIEIAFRSHSGDKVFFGGNYEIIVNLLFTNYED